MKKLFVLFFLLLNLNNLKSQGLNNNHSLDSVDFREVFNLMGIEVFKFPFEKTDQEFTIKISLQDYDNGKLINTFPIFSLSGLPDEIKEEFQRELNINKKSALLRVYSKQNNDSSFTLAFTLNFLTQKYDFTSDPKEGMNQWRAYTNFQPEKGKQVPFLIRYGVLKGTPMISCPGNMPIPDVIKRYPYVLAFIVEVE
jgi:hypothetical protein